MATKADKLRGKLGSYAKEREQFEQKKRELEEEMSKGKQNMGKIRKGLRGNEIKMEQPLSVEAMLSGDLSAESSSLKLPPDSVRKPPSRLVKKQNSNSNLNNEISPSKTLPIPSCPMLSEWVFTAPLDSTPPVFKNQELYETVRMLGRGSFGTVDLVKNVDDNRL